MFDTDKIEKIGPDYWRNSHLSLARFYGKIRICDVLYILDPATDYLVREDVLNKEAKAAVDAKKRAKADADKKQLGLFGGKSC